MKKLLMVLTALGWVALCCMVAASILEAVGGSPDLGNSLSPVVKIVFPVLVVLAVISLIWTVHDNSRH